MNNTDFPKTGLVRLSSILAPRGPIPVSKSTWWAKVKSGEFPQPVKLTSRVTCWKAQEIWSLLDRINGEEA